MAISKTLGQKIAENKNIHRNFFIPAHELFNFTVHILKCDEQIDKKLYRPKYAGLFNIISKVIDYTWISISFGIVLIHFYIIYCAIYFLQEINCYFYVALITTFIILNIFMALLIVLIFKEQHFEIEK